MPGGGLEAADEVMKVRTRAAEGHVPTLPAVASMKIGKLLVGGSLALWIKGDLR